MNESIHAKLFHFLIIHINLLKNDGLSDVDPILL